MHFRFVNFLKTFTSDEMEIAFNAERSIQDAIEELSESESSTVLISYTVMFIYVAVALGSFRSFHTFLVSNKKKIAKFHEITQLMQQQTNSFCIYASYRSIQNLR